MFTAADIVSSYSRAEAITDGVLVDVTDAAKAVGFRVPVALTRAAWESFVGWDEADSKRTGALCSEADRLEDVLYIARNRIVTARRQAASGADDSRLAFQVHRVPREGNERRRQLGELVITIGPGDAGEPVMTIMLPDED